MWALDEPIAKYASRFPWDKTSGMAKQNTSANSYKEISEEHNNARKYKQHMEMKTIIFVLLFYVFLYGISHCQTFEKSIF